MDELGAIYGALVAIDRDVEYIRVMTIGMRGNITGVGLAASSVGGQSNKSCMAAVKQCNLAANELANVLANAIAARNNLRAYYNKLLNG